MKLTKKYRILWNDERTVDNPYKDWSGTTTFVGVGTHCFESDNKADIETKIQEENLTITENQNK